MLPAGIAGPAAKSDVSAIAQRSVEANVSPAVQIGLARKDRATSTFARGLANIETRTPADASSVFRIGSLTKQFTGVLMLKLASDRKLALDAPVSRYLPFFEKHPSVSVTELLQHTAGIHDDEEAPPLTGDVTQVRLAEAISRQAKLFDFAPGTAWLYGNANYILLGAIIESVTGGTMQQALERYITGPLGLKQTAFDDPGAIVAGRASGYTPGEGEGNAFRNAPWIDVIQAGAAGAMRSTAAELVAFHRALLSGPLLTEQERAMFLAPARLRDGRLASANRFSEHDSAMGDTQYGFGVYLDTSTRDRSLIVHHNGFISGFSAYLASHVASRTTVACLCNVDPNPKLPFRELRRTVFAAFLDPPKG